MVVSTRSETIVSFAKNMMELEETVETLVLEGLGARGESIGAHFGLLGHNFRLSHYGVPPDTESSMSLQPHYDSIVMTAIVQHEVEGLEVHVDGRWVAVPAETGTFTFVAGEQFRVRARSDRIDSRLLTSSDGLPLSFLLRD
jgi:isopenicillin N synthase-like dioxygenase